MIFKLYTLFTNGYRKVIFAAVMLIFTHGTVLACMDSQLMQQQYAVEGLAESPDGIFLYSEELRHEPNDTGGVLTVIYKDPKGQVLANKTVSYNCKSTTPDFELVDRVNQKREGVRWQGNTIVSYQGEQSTALVPPENPAIFDAGFDNAIKLNWEQLIAGEKLVFEYLFARDNRFLKLKLQQTPAPKNLQRESEPNIVFFKISAKNILLRLISQPLFVGYHVPSRSLRYYSGPSNLPNVPKKQSVLIRYQQMS